MVAKIDITELTSGYKTESLMQSILGKQNSVLLVSNFSDPIFTIELLDLQCCNFVEMN